jgi:hypothetical protein
VFCLRKDLLLWKTELWRYENCNAQFHCGCLKTVTLSLKFTEWLKGQLIAGKEVSKQVLNCLTTYLHTSFSFISVN